MNYPTRKQSTTRCGRKTCRRRCQPGKKSSFSRNVAAALLYSKWPSVTTFRPPEKVLLAHGQLSICWTHRRNGFRVRPCFGLGFDVIPLGLESLAALRYLPFQTAASNLRKQKGDCNRQKISSAVRQRPVSREDWGGVAFVDVISCADRRGGGVRGNTWEDAINKLAGRPIGWRRPPSLSDAVGRCWRVHRLTRLMITSLSIVLELPTSVWRCKPSWPRKLQGFLPIPTNLTGCYRFHLVFAMKGLSEIRCRFVGISRLF